MAASPDRYDDLYTYVGNDPTDRTDPTGNFGIGIDLIFGDAEIGYDLPSDRFFISGRAGVNLPPARISILVRAAWPVRLKALRKAVHRAMCVGLAYRAALTWRLVPIGTNP
jgi:hypothetical protein